MPRLRLIIIWVWNKEDNNIKIKVYDRYDEYIDDYSKDKENYFGKLVFAYDKERFFIVLDYDL